MSDPSQVQFFSYDDADALHPVPGIEMRAVFGAGASVNLVHLASGAELPLHSHPHEQIGVVLEGVQVLIVDGQEHHLGVNEAYVMPGGVEHGGRGGPDGCRVLDVFVPGREDYRSAAAPARR
jgi:quercetin dioxygenase-like cupin family protein